MEMQRIQKSLNDFEKEGLTLSDFKSYKSTQIRTALYQDRKTDQQNMIQSPETDPYIYGKWILMKVQRQLRGERTIPLTSGVITVGHSCANKKEKKEGREGGTEGGRKEGRREEKKEL